MLAAAAGDDVVEQLLVQANGTVAGGDDLTQQVDGPSSLSLSVDGSVLGIGETASSSVVLYRDGAYQSQLSSAVADGLDGLADLVLDTSESYFFTAGRDEQAVGVVRVRPRRPGAAQQMRAVDAAREGLDGVSELLQPTDLAVMPGTSCVYVGATGSSALVVFEASSDAGSPPLFSDGFESGDVAAWSEALGSP